MGQRNTKDWRSTGFCIVGTKVDPGRHRVLIDGQEIKLEPKVMAVLAYLADRFPVVVERGELFAEVWGQTAVSDETLTMAVSKLRRALGDDPRAPRIIETIPKGGYRLMVSPEPLATEVSSLGSTVSVQNDSGSSSSGPQKSLLIALGVCLVAMLGFSLRPRSPAELRLDLFESHPLTALPGREIHPAVSPDGRRVVFVHQRDSGEIDLFLRSIDDEKLVQLTDDPAVELRPAWSPDGFELAYARIEEGRCDMLRRSVIDGQTRRIADCGEASSPDLAWSPDGDGMAFPERAGPERGIGIVQLSLKTGARRFITDPAEPAVRDLRPSFSSTGDLLAFVRQQADGHSDLYIVPLAGGEPQRVATAVEHLWGHAWTRDDQGLIYSSLIGDAFALRWVDRTGEGGRWLPIPGVEIARDPSTARRADVLVFEDWSYDANILRRPSGDEGEPVPVASSTAWDSAPQLSPDGTLLSFVSSRSGRGGLWVSDADGSRARQLASGVRVIESVPRWSPSSDRLVFVSGERESPGIAVVRVVTGEVVSAGPLTVDGRAPAWSADGQTLYYASTQGGSWQVWKIRLSDGDASQVTRVGGFAAQESGDGSWLFFTKPRVAGLWRQPVGGGSAEKIVDDLAPSFWGSWFLTEDSVIFARADAGSTILVEQGLASGQERDVARLPGTLLNPGLAASLDGQTFWYSRLDRSESDLRWVDISVLIDSK